MTIPKNLKEENKGLGEWAILTSYRGSIVHGTYLPENHPNSVDDKDVMAVCVPDIDHYYGLKTFHSKGTQEIKYNEWDIVVYEAKKFISLLANGNPNVLMMLWLEPNYYTQITSAGYLILENKELFSGKHVYHPFVGYAKGQLHRMTHTQYRGHMGAKRKALVEQFGYDCKNAQHLIRILRMGKEFLIEGEMHVLRKDASELLEIKKGEWSLERVMELADKEFALAEQAYQNSKLPNRPDRDKINQLCVSVISEAFNDRK